MTNKSQETKHSFQHIIIIFALSVFLLLSGCDILPTQQPIPPTATATQTLTPTATIDWFPATATPTLLPRASATPQPTLANLREGVTELLIEDDFTDENLWTTLQSASGNIAFGTENLTLAVARPETFLTSVSQHDLPANFYLEVTVQTLLCQPADQIGINFWHQSMGNYYRLLLNCAGQYRLELVQDGVSTVIHDWESARGMRLATPASNRLGLWVYQGRFQLTINDVFQFEERVAQERNGALAVYARTVSGSAMTARFSNLEIYRVEEE